MKMRRREFITFLGGAAAAWPLAARAQQRGLVKRVGVLAGSDDERIRVFREGMQKLGWIEGRNLRIDTRFTGTDPDRMRTYAVELVGLGPDVIVTSSAPAARTVQEQTQAIPIVFMGGNDPVANGLLQNIARPEGNTTGFTSTVDSLIGKWLELLKEAAPHITRAALVFNPQTVNVAYFSPIEAAPPMLGVLAHKTSVRDSLEVVRALDAFAAEPNGGVLIVPVLPSDSTQTLLRLAAQHRLPFTRIGAASPQAR
jgi:putative ABC transport system substrate-binding protein